MRGFFAGAIALVSVVSVGVTPAAAQRTDTEKFDVGGVSVILRQSSTAGLVVANLYLLGGVRQASPETAGTEAFLLDASEYGTRSYPRDVLRQRMSRLGSNIVVAPAHDWTMIGLRTSTDRFDSTWAILADRVMHPTFPEREVELVTLCEPAVREHIARRGIALIGYDELAAAP